jgi:hypothetical protein
MVAVHLAKTKQLEFLCADRTFSSLSAVGDFSFGRYLGLFYRFLTLWNDDIVNDYLGVMSYKLISFDPKDEVIHMLSSLRSGINKRILEKRIGVDTQGVRYKNSDSIKIYLPQTWKNCFKGLKSNLEFEKVKSKVAHQISEDIDLLTKEQTNALFFAFKRISDLFFILSQVQQSNAFGNNKEHKRSRSQENLKKLNKGPHKPGTGSLESSFNFSTITSNLVNVVSNEVNMEESVLQPRHGGGIRPDESMSFMVDTRVINEAINENKNINQVDEMYLITSLKRPSYVNLFDEDAQSSDDVIAFLLKV